MALFLTNTGLSTLKYGDSLDEATLLALMEQGKRNATANGEVYYTRLLDSGLELVFRVSEREGGVDVYGLDTHMAGRCVWTAQPVVTVGKPEYLGMDLLLTDPSQHCAFVMGIVRSALLAPIDDHSILDIQVCAFPTGMDVYDSREAFEAMVPEENRPLDRQILPYHYLLAREESVPKKVREASKKQEMINLFCGPVLATQKRDNGFQGTSLFVSTVATEMGHIDVVYDGTQVEPPEPGSYLVASAYFSGDVLSIRQADLVP
ncbi:MAG: hypothetical protein LKK25_00260 [Sphaerochaeta sp.]|jgi:hypothetical protein|nr:hypothetical protein [Sphaerochaeta sp.]